MHMKHFYQDSMKRCQSVEVLSVQDRHPAKPPSNRPPPLPPKSTDRPLEGVLNNSLANEVEVVEESNRAAKQEDKKVVRFKKAVPEGSTTSLRRPYHKRRSSGKQIINTISYFPSSSVSFVIYFFTALYLLYCL